MMSPAVRLLCVMTLMLGQASAQEKPDFSGDWLLVTAVDSGSSVAREMTVTQSFQWVSATGTAIDPPIHRLSVERRAGASIRRDAYAIGMDGGLVGGTVGRDGTTSWESRVSTRWDTVRLVIETSSYYRSPAAVVSRSDHREVWSLDNPDALSVTVTDRIEGAEPATTTSFVYRRVAR